MDSCLLSCDSKIEGASLPVVSISGAASGMGKTAVAEAAIRVLTRAGCRVGAAKVTVTHPGKGCPHGGKSCGVCGSLGDDFYITEKHSVINTEKTDTARFVAAGAAKTLWLVTKPDAAREAWRQLSRRYGEADVVVIESNTLASIATAVPTVFVADPGINSGIWKASTRELIERAELLVVNHHRASSAGESSLAQLLEWRCGKLVLEAADPRHLDESPLFIDTMIRSAGYAKK